MRLSVRPSVDNAVLIPYRPRDDDLARDHPAPARSIPMLSGKTIAAARNACIPACCRTALEDGWSGPAGHRRPNSTLLRPGYVSALRVLAIVPTRFYSPVGQGHRSWALPAASGSSVCPSPDFWASSPVRRPFEACFPPPRTRPAAAPARLHAAFPGPAAATTLTPALAAQRRPFRPV